MHCSSAGDTSQFKRFRFPHIPLRGCCLHQEVGSTVCMAVLSGRVCTKICFHRCFLGRYFLWADLRQSSLNSQSSAGSGKEMGQRGTAAGSSPLFHLLPKTVRHSHCSRSKFSLPGWTPHLLHLLCGSVPISICGCANDTGGINQKESLNSWEMGTNLLTAFLMKLQMVVLMPELLVLCIHLGLQKWRKVKQSWQPTLSVRFLFLYFLDHYLALPGSLCSSSKQLISWKRFLFDSSHLQLSCLDVSG